MIPRTEKNYWESNKSAIEKPPIGIMPKTVWQTHRIKELLGAIDRYVSIGRVDDLVCGWVSELNELTKQMTSLQRKSARQGNGHR